jgi:hypothetical protein
MARLGATLVCVTAAVLAATRAQAQTHVGYAGNTFSPPDRGSSWFVLDSLGWSAKGTSFVMGTTGHFSRGTVRLDSSDAGAACPSSSCGIRFIRAGRLNGRSRVLFG